MKETPRARQAFADYLRLGDGRSLEKLAEVYQGCTVSIPTKQLSRLKRWSQQHGWQARLGEIVEEERQAIVNLGIAEKQNRIDAYNDRWQRMRKVIGERAKDPEVQEVPGGKTGLIVHNVKGVGKGDDFQLIDLYEVDTGLLKELRAHEEQAAKELGQWTEKRETVTKLKLENLSDEELSTLEQLVGKTTNA